MTPASTRVLLLNIPSQWSSWLLFGHPETRYPIHSEESGSTAEIHTFTPDSWFGLSRQRLNDYGIVDWEMFFLRAVRPGETANVLPGVHPGAELMLYTHGKRRASQVQRYLELLTDDGLDPASLPQLHRKATPFLQRGILPRRLVHDHLDLRTSS